MTKQEMVIDILNECGCLTSTEIKGRIFRKFNETLSPASIASILRPYIARGLAASSPNASGKRLYWLNRNLIWEDTVND